MAGEDDPVGLELDENGELPQIWQITLADLSMLLMTFFIFLFALSSIKPENVNDTLESVRQRLRVNAARPGPDKIPGGEGPQEKVLQQVTLREQLILRQRQVYEDLTAFFRGRGETSLHTKLEGPRMTLSLPTDGMFAAGDVTQLTDAGRQRLDGIVKFLARHPDQRVHIKGFTDDALPPPGSRFKNNWEVSSIEAVTALRYLLSQGVPANRLTSTGLADLEPLLPNTNDANRAKNRRLEFVMEVQVEG